MPFAGRPGTYTRSLTDTALAAADAGLAAFGQELLALTPGELEEFCLANPDLIDVVEAALAEEDLERFIAGRALAEVRTEAEQSGTHWMRVLFPSYARFGFAPHMQQIWEWAWAVRRGVRPPPLVAVIFRGGAKSTSAEAALAAMGARGVRRYALIVSNTQDQADEHVANLGEMLASPRFAALYPDMAARAVTQYGSSRGWSRKRLHTASGFVVDALGLEKNVRGLRVDEERPDAIVLDDVDSDTDGPAAVQKKIDLITRKILPTGSADLAVLAVQNLVHPNSIFARLAGRAEERADFLVDRIVIGPIPAIEGLEVDVEPATGRHVVVGGTPTWVGYDLPRAQDAIDTFGYTSFLAEVQHVVKPASGGMFDRVRFVRCDPPEVPPLSMRTCWVDPAVEGGEQNDSQAIQIDGLSPSGVIYRLWSWEGKIGPQEAIEIALRHAIRYGCSTLGIETDQGGKTWTSVYKEACRTIRDRYCGTCWARFGQPEDDEVVARALRDQHCRDENHAVFAGPFPGYRSEKAGAGLGPKAHRASQMLADYEIGGRIVHVRGTHVVLEAALTRFPKVKPFDLTDASFYSWRACSTRRSGMSTGRSGRTAARTQMPSVLG